MDSLITFFNSQTSQGAPTQVASQGSSQVASPAASQGSSQVASPAGAHIIHGYEDMC